jgi:hypothetical protein
MSENAEINHLEAGIASFTKEFKQVLDVIKSGEKEGERNPFAQTNLQGDMDISSFSENKMMGEKLMMVWEQVKYILKRLRNERLSEAEAPEFLDKVDAEIKYIYSIQRELSTLQEPLPGKQEMINFLAWSVNVVGAYQPYLKMIVDKKKKLEVVQGYIDEEMAELDKGPLASVLST